MNGFLHLLISVYFSNRGALITNCVWYNSSKLPRASADKFELTYLKFSFWTFKKYIVLFGDVVHTSKLCHGIAQRVGLSHSLFSYHFEHFHTCPYSYVPNETIIFVPSCLSNCFSQAKLFHAFTYHFLDVRVLIMYIESKILI